MQRSIAPPSSQSESGFNLQQMLQSIGASQNVPPFLQSLASSLQLLQLHQSTQTTASTTAAETGSNMPLELTQMMDAFKQMRPPPPPTINTKDNEASHTTNGEAEDTANGKEEDKSGQKDEGQVNERVAKLLEESVSELERRLQSYVDSKLAELEMKLVMKLDKLTARIDTLNRQSQNTDYEQCNTVRSNGIVHAMPLSEDQQLD